MCGIVGYAGRKRAEPILFSCLSKLEYRGYDSCGIAVQSSPVNVYKGAVRVKELEDKAPKFSGMFGIGHTRWATHGVPSKENAHPILDCTGKIAVVHNGIIDNFRELRKQLVSEGHTFGSETDTEVIPHLIEKHYKNNLESAVEDAMGELKGSYAMAVLMANSPKVVAARKDCPLLIGVGDGDNFLASSISAVLNYTNRVIYLEDEDVATISKDSVIITNNGKKVIRKEHKISYTGEETSKAGYEHFMIKEIHEQPEVIRNTIDEYLSKNGSKDNLWQVYDQISESLLIVACGSSYHAGLISKYFIEELLGIQTRIELASEFNHGRRIIPTAEAIAITQSGETADVLTAMKHLKKAGIKSTVVTNTPHSSATRFANHSIYTKAGIENSVAATKTFLAQLIALYCMAMSRIGINSVIYQNILNELEQLPDKVQNVLDSKYHIADGAKYLADYNNIFFIGRGISYPVALEGALKLKEISYIHAEAYAAGELKHGPFALLDIDTPVIAIAPHDNTYQTMLNNIKEVKARKAPVMALVDIDDEVIGQLADIIIRVPHTSSLFSPVVNTVTLQLLAYYTAKNRGCPIDFPRNLAKSVTVE